MTAQQLLDKLQLLKRRGFNLNVLDVVTLTNETVEQYPASYEETVCELIDIRMDAESGELVLECD